MTLPLYIDADIVIVISVVYMYFDIIKTLPLYTDVDIVILISNIYMYYDIIMKFNIHYNIANQYQQYNIISLFPF